MAVQDGVTSLPYKRKYPDTNPVTITKPVIIETPVANSCNCHTGSNLEQKIKENPMIFVIGALIVGYLLAKN